MRKILMAMAILFSMGCMGQSYMKINRDTLFVDKQWKVHSPGEELKMASKEYYRGLMVATIGSISVGSVAYILISNNSQGKHPILISIVFAVPAIIGAVQMIHSHIHLKRAGIILDERGVGLSIPIKYKPIEYREKRKTKLFIDEYR
jgi:hypothetical protein